MNRGVYSTFGPERSLHVIPIEPIYRGGKRKTERYWKWFIIDETTGEVTHLGSAPTKEAALREMTYIT